MDITGINFRFITFNRTFDHTIEWDLTFTGEDRVITKTVRDSYETKVSTYRLTQETVDGLLALVEQYGIKDWTGKEPAPPRVCDDEHTLASCLMVLRFEDGTEGKITFREASEEAGREAS
ncbi:MAG: hypothetical protein IKX80_00700, partial [Lachnospiraceae bacterium]|nr:hypothetical protein [Lachnospiraceae bacterium]